MDYGGLFGFKPSFYRYVYLNADSHISIKIYVFKSRYLFQLHLSVFQIWTSDFELEIPAFQLEISIIFLNYIYTFRDICI